MAHSFKLLTRLKPQTSYFLYIGGVKIQTNREILTPEDKYNLIYSLLDIENSIKESSIKILSIIDSHDINQTKDKILKELKIHLIKLQCVALLLDELAETYPDPDLEDLRTAKIYHFISESKKLVETREQILEKVSARLPKVSKEKSVDDVNDFKLPSPRVKHHLNKCSRQRLHITERKPLQINPPKNKVVLNKAELKEKVILPQIKFKR